MPLTKISGDVIQVGAALSVGVVTATSAVVGSGVTITGSQINVGSATTIHSSGFQIGSSNLHSTGITVNGVNVSGVITATSFSGDGSTLTGIGDTIATANLSYLAALRAGDASTSYFTIVNQFVDSFNDSAGIDTSNSSNYNRNTTSKYVTGALDILSGTGSTDSSTVTIGSTSYTFYQVQSGVSTLTVSNAPITFDVLVVGGGGGGGSSYGGGGGGGLVIWGRNIVLPAPGSYPMQVGEGGLFSGNRGSAPTSDYDWGGTPGYATTFAGGTGYALTATGGGGGSGIRWAPYCTNNAQGSPGANGGGGGNRHPACPSVPFVGGTGSKPPDITASPTNIWGTTSTITYYGGNSGGNGSTSPFNEGGGGGGAGGAGTNGDSSGPTLSTGGIGVSIPNMAPDGLTYFWAGGGGGAGSGAYYAPPQLGAPGGKGGGGGGYNYNGGAGLYGNNGGSALRSVAPSPGGDLNGAGIRNSGGGGGGGGSPRTPFGDMNGGPGYVLLRATTSAITAINNMTLVGITTTAAATPSKGSLFVLIEDLVGTSTLNTDIKGYVSRDGGTTYTQGTFASLGSWGTNKSIISFNDLSISSQPSGTSMKYKITTHNQSASKSVAVHSVNFSWKT